MEVEKGIAISKTESYLLRRLLPLIGFHLAIVERITDFVVPSSGDKTERMRVIRSKLKDGSRKVHYFQCRKSHPITGGPGQHARDENEHQVKRTTAAAFVLTAIKQRKELIPFYNKKRLTFKGEYKGFAVSIALDHAQELGCFSGFYMEIEVILPHGSEHVGDCLAAIDMLIRELLNEKRPLKISYRKMLMETWSARRMTRGSYNKKLIKTFGLTSLPKHVGKAKVS